MMTKQLKPIILVFSIVVVIWFVFYVLSGQAYVLYRPMVMGNDPGPLYLPAPHLMNSGHSARAEVVLKAYGFKCYRNQSGELMIQRSLLRDPDMLCNITKKADNGIDYSK